MDKTCYAKYQFVKYQFAKQYSYAPFRFFTYVFAPFYCAFAQKVTFVRAKVASFYFEIRNVMDEEGEVSW